MKKQLLKKFVASLAGAGVGLALLAVPAFAMMPRTTTVWTTTNQDGVLVTPYSMKNKVTGYQAMVVDLDLADWSNVAYVYYNLNYTSKKTNVAGGVEGSINPSVDKNFAGDYNGMKYYRRHLVFGTCSGQACVYDQPKSVSLKVNTKYLAGKIDQYTKILSFLDDQF